MNDKLKVYLLQGRYSDAEKICRNMNSDKIRDTIMTIAYDTESLTVYSFAQYMINKTKEISWTELAIDIMINPLCFIEGAYSVALFHARELVLINRSVKNLERILFFYNIPEKLISIGEAKCIAEEILKIDSNNEVALEI